MSTDVYFDFHSVKAYPYWVNFWNNKQNNSELYLEWLNNSKNPGDYSPVRVAYLSNLVGYCTADKWEDFQHCWHSTLICESNIQSLSEDWDKIFKETQNPDNLEDCGGYHSVNDIKSAKEITALLTKYIGHILTFRVD